MTNIGDSFVAMPEAIDNPTRAFGTTGLRRYGGQIYEDPLSEVQGIRGIGLYNEMGTDAVVGAMLLTLTLLARQVTFRTDPADDSPRAREIADHVDSCWRDMGTQTWESAVASIMSMLQYGFSWHELTFKLRQGADPRGGGEPSRFTDGRWGIAGLHERGQDSIQQWLFDDDIDKLVGLRQVDPRTARSVDLSAARAVHATTTTTKANPEGRSILRSAVKPWRLKWRMEEFEAIGVERDLVGLPVFLVPPRVMSPNASPDDKALYQAARQIVREVRRNNTEGIVIPQMWNSDGHQEWDFKLLTSGGNRQFDIDKTVARHDARILLAGLSDVLLLGNEGVSGLGTAGLGITKADLMHAAISAFCDSVAAELTAKVCTLITRLNGWPLELTPIIRHGQVEQVDLIDLSDYILKLSQSGAQMFPSPELEEYLHGIADLPYDPERAAAVVAGHLGALAEASAARTGELPPPSGPMISGLAPDELLKVANAHGTLTRSGADAKSASDALGLPATIVWTGAIPVTLRPTEEQAGDLEGGPTPGAAPSPGGDTGGLPPEGPPDADPTA